ncbi:MAG TPA: Smr/MutS family protein [Acidobacteriaceae bacterium]|nr:Smr/MutS family protein [Acidobacteriaceae bacterium]
MILTAQIPGELVERGGVALEWERMRERLGVGAGSVLGRNVVVGLEPSGDAVWVGEQQQRTEEMRRLVAAGKAFDFKGIMDPEEMLERARIEGAALEASELLTLLNHANVVEKWRKVVVTNAVFGGETRGSIVELASIAGLSRIAELSRPLLERELGGLVRALEGKIEPDGSLADDASPELARIRRALARQHRVIEESLRKALASLSEGGSTQGDLITVRGERFVIPVKAEFKRKLRGILHGSSSSGQTVYLEPMETVDENNELARLLDDEQAEIHRILVAMTRAVAAESEALMLGAEILAEADAHQAVAKFAEEMDCVRPVFVDAVEANERGLGSEGEAFELVEARHPLLELRMRAEQAANEDADERRIDSRSVGEIVPLTIRFAEGERQMIVSGPNTGGKSVALKTVGLLAVMAQAGVPVPAKAARLPMFTAVYSDIGDAQSIEQDLSTFSAHVVNVERIARAADESSLVLIDELGSATDPDEGSALAVAVAEHFLKRRAWSVITTHLTALKVYAAKHEGVVNAAVGFDEATLTPTYELRLGVPGASAGLNIAARLGLDAEIVASARAQMTTQQADIGRFLEELHAQLTAATAERAALAELERRLASERAKLEQEGRAEQQARTREWERRLAGLIQEFEAQLRETVKAIDDKKIAQRIAKDSALRIARLRREFSEQFQTAVAEHEASGEGIAGAGASGSASSREPRVGDLVRLRSLHREGRVVRVVEKDLFEVMLGAIKMRVPMSDVAEVTPVRERPAESVRRRGGITVSTGADEDELMSSEINVIGKTADEAESEVERFVERAFLAGLPRIRVVHGVGMGVLRRTLREMLRKHPHVVGVAEPPYNEGGQGVTVVELRQ